MSQSSLLAGAATRCITPNPDERPVFLAGFQNNRRATAIDTDLYVRALALRLDERVAVIAACDLIGLDRGDVLDVRAALDTRGIDSSGLVVACTHTHSGPDTLGLWGPDRSVSGVDPLYLASVKQAIVDAVIEALTFCCPARLRCGMTQLPGYIANFRDPGIVDDEVAVLQFVKLDGEVIATLLNLACHPEVLDGDSTLISADYAGYACREVETRVGGVALHVSGALGGMLSPDTNDRTPAWAEHMGRAYAETALTALAAQPTVEVERLDVRRAEFDLPLANPLLLMAQQMGVLRARQPVNGAIITCCTSIDLGPAQIITIPGELLPRLGFELKAMLPGPCRMLIGLADDEIGYILPDDEFIPPADYMNPGKQYEESMSIGPTTGSRLLTVARGLIEDR
ncbi:hypothetical protein [Roseiflexus sp.]|uniref:hypothetical protein n=1 Tax=Roseiflexus sp. TaxID=2562120 RepID=UPI0021DC9E7C|nr:hypothetical protein [Roseiflexus sp.]GIW00355.1 MAG: hypothetical protein KatS3mg058_1758 [Roseiflexus sp.]